MGGRDLAVVLQFLVRELTDTKLFLVPHVPGKRSAQQPLLTQTLAAIARPRESQSCHLRGPNYSEVRALWS